MVLLELGELLGSDKVKNGGLCDPLELDPLHDLQLVFDGVVGHVGQAVTPRVTATAVENEPLQTELDRAAKAERDLLQCNGLLVTSSYIILLLVFGVHGVYRFQFVRIFISVSDQVSVSRYKAVDSLELEDYDQCSEK